MLHYDFIKYFIETKLLINMACVLVALLFHCNEGFFLLQTLHKATVNQDYKTAHPIFIHTAIIIMHLIIPSALLAIQLWLSSLIYKSNVHYNIFINIHPYFYTPMSYIFNKPEIPNQQQVTSFHVLRLTMQLTVIIWQILYRYATLNMKCNVFCFE